MPFISREPKVILLSRDGEDCPIPVRWLCVPKDFQAAEVAPILYLPLPKNDILVCVGRLEAADKGRRDTPEAKAARLLIAILGYRKLRDTLLSQDEVLDLKGHFSVCQWWGTTLKGWAPKAYAELMSKFAELELLRRRR
jgi:hypothetical protein